MRFLGRKRAQPWLHGGGWLLWRRSFFCLGVSLFFIISSRYPEYTSRGGGQKQAGHLFSFHHHICLGAPLIKGRGGHGPLGVFFAGKRICICAVSDLEKLARHVYIWMDVYTEVGREDLTQEEMYVTCRGERRDFSAL